MLGVESVLSRLLPFGLPESDDEPPCDIQRYEQFHLHMMDLVIAANDLTDEQMRVLCSFPVIVSEHRKPPYSVFTAKEIAAFIEIPEQRAKDCLNRLKQKKILARTQSGYRIIPPKG
ncbi:hypothetical protein BW247_05040 [Acidihalobacter ferrooxydans]|uniref:Uncharacterized protein n=2 Tax=Acidihalobacter ferrooxydans TaxID=1765967 RepID=A0A1P8UFC2_9GAMM|nr:hypothetical protein BW247_05040 [Acidihalobacter ferrooxydans]